MLGNTPLSTIRLFLYLLLLMTSIVSLPREGVFRRFLYILSLAVFTALSAADVAALVSTIRWRDFSVLHLFPIPLDLIGAAFLAAPFFRTSFRPVALDDDRGQIR